MKTGHYLAIAIASIAAPLLQAEDTTKAPVPEFHASNQRLEPTTTVEIRFKTEMIPPTLVGKDPGMDILKIKPVWKGSVSWISRSSVLFRPGEKPQIGRDYTFTLASELKDLEGREVPVENWNRSSFDFGVTASDRNYIDSATHGSRLPRIVVLFNAKVDAEELASHTWIESTDRDLAATTVRQATAADIRWSSTLSRHWSQITGRPSSELPEESEEIIDHAVVISPVDPLRAGKTWNLAVEEGFTSTEGPKLAKAYRATAGTVAHLEISQPSPVNHYNTKRYLIQSFNKPLASTVDNTQLARFLSITPDVPNLNFELQKNRKSVTITGDFRVRHNYEITARGGLRASDGTLSVITDRRKFSFTPNYPQLYLPEFESGQLLSGNRQYPIRLGNIGSTHVRVKAADPDELFQLLRGYRHYTDFGWSDKRKPSAKEIPFDVLPGKVVLDKVFTSTKALDEQETLTLNWDEILGTNQASSLFIHVEASARSDAEKKTFVAQSVVQLTDLGVVWKATKDSALVHVFSQATGKPVKGALVEALDNNREIIGKTKTDESGTASVKVNGASWIIARKGNDRYGLRFDKSRDEIALWRMDVPNDYGHNSRAGRRTLFFTDRPVYKPGETVNFKAVLRQLKEDQLHVPGGQEAKLRVFDSRGRKIAERDVNFDDRGSFDSRIDLPESPLGYYRVDLIFKPGDGEPQQTDWANISAWNRTASAVFQVQEFKPNAFEVHFENNDIVADGETVSVPLRANYLMGAPLSKARLVWNARQSPASFSAKEFENFRFGDSRREWIQTEAGWKRWRKSVSQPSAEQGEQFLDPEGKSVIVTKRMVIEEITGPLRLSVETDITDVNQQTLSRSTSHTMHPSKFYLGMGGLDQIAKAGTSLELQVAAVTPDGQAFKGKLQPEVTVGRVVWNSVRLKSAGTSNSVNNDFRIDPIMVSTLELAKGETGTASFTPEAAGTYLLTAAVKLKDGRTVKTTTNIDVYGSDWAPWWQTDGFLLELIADKERYLPGETAKILVKSNLQGKALVTLERGSILKEFITDIPNNATTLEIPIDDKCAPNVSVSVVVLRGSGESTKKNPKSEYRVGYCTLQVDPTNHRLDVAIEPADPEVRPGAETEITATVTDSEGNPVANAEVTLYAADEGVLSLVNFTAPNPENTFLTNWPLLVRSGVSLNRMLAEEKDEMAFANKGFEVGGGGPGGMQPPPLARKNFKSTAFWEPSLRTDVEGKVRARFYAPDNLTRFRIIAVATEGADRFGSEEGEFLINKPLMLEPAVPRFAHVGDEITVRAVLHNRTDKPAVVNCKLIADDHVGIGKAGKSRTFARRIELAAGETNDLRIPVRFLEAGETVWNWSAVSEADPSLNDAVESKFQIEYAEPELREIHFVSLRNGSAGNLLEGFNAELLEGSGKIEVSVSNSRLLEAAPAAEKLLHYPYGCVEQTSSSTLPWIVLRDLKEVIPVLNRSAEEYDQAIASGCARLLSMQTASGGLSYWPGDGDPVLWGSNSGGYVLAMAKKQGADIPQHRLDSLADWMAKQLENTGNLTDRSALIERAATLHTLVLLGKPQAAYHAVLARKKEELPIEARLRLCLAILESGGDKEWCREIITAKERKTENWAYWHGPSYQAALELMVWTRIDGPQSENAIDAYEKLLKMRRKEGDWGTTYTNNWAIQAAKDFLDESMANARESTLAIHLGDEKKSIDLPAKPYTESVTLPFADIGRAGKLAVKGDGTENLIAKIEVTSRPPRMPQKARNNGFSIARKYERINAEGDPESASNLRIGDLVKVTLSFNIPEAVNYLVIDDPLPALLEGVNPNFVGKAGSSARRHNSRNYWWNSHQEMRDNRVVFFRDSCRQLGDYEITYLARVIAAGKVTAPPVKIEGMYEPDRFGLSASEVLTATATSTQVTSR